MAKFLKCFDLPPFTKNYADILKMEILAESLKYVQFSQNVNIKLLSWIPRLIFRLFAPLPLVARYITCTVGVLHVNFRGRQSAPTKTTATVVFVEGGVSRSSLQGFNKSKNFASFRSKILHRKGLGGTARTLFMSFSSFGSTGQLSRRKKKPSLMFLHPPLLFFFFCSLSFFYSGRRLAGLSMAHICSSSLLVFTTSSGSLPPRLMDSEE